MQPQPTGSLEDRIAMLEYIATGKLAFGTDLDPQDPGNAIALPAGSSATAHNGFNDNIQGSWAMVRLVTANPIVTVHHNLGVPIIATNQLNVRWMVLGFQHTGQGVGNTSTISVMYNPTTAGPTLTENSIDLQFSTLNRTVGANNALLVRLFFVPAARDT